MIRPSQAFSIGVAKRPEGVRKQHGALFSPEGDRAAARGGPLAVDEVVFECRIQNAELAFPIGEGGGEADG